MKSLRVSWRAVLVVWSASALLAQEKPSSTALLPKAVAVSPSATEEDSGSCRPLELLSAKELSLHQRTCLYSQKLLSKGFLARALVFSAYGEMKNNPAIPNQGMGDYAHRVATYYARRTAQSTGELLAAYWNHEDPRFHSSQEHGFWNRTRSAFRGVVMTTNEDGKYRPAFAPIAGSFGSGLTGIALYRNHNGWDDGFRRTGISYSTYFVNAFFREFQPELSGYANHLLHRHR